MNNERWTAGAVIGAVIALCGTHAGSWAQPLAGGAASPPGEEAWQRYCLAHYDEWMRTDGRGLVGRGYPNLRCARAFAAGHDTAAREAAVKASIASAARAPAGSGTAAPVPAPRLVRAPTAAEMEGYYPISSLKAGEQGRAVASCELDGQGYPGHCTIAESSGYAALDAATIAVVTKTMRFTATTIVPEPVRRVRVPITWTLPSH